MTDSRAVRFQVKPAGEGGLSPTDDAERGRATTAPVGRFEPTQTPPTSPSRHDSQSRHSSRYQSDSFGSDMPEQGIHPLFPDEEQHRPKVTRALRSLSIYNPILPGNSETEKKQRKSAAGDSIDIDIDDVNRPRGAQMGTLMGVYLPCIQNIFGVLFFIRLAWIVGTAGVVQGFFIVLICCVVTFLTSISLSAIATNGIVPGGGPYYMISRNLGPELGGAVGILFYLGTSIAGAMYIVGAVEIFILYLVPQARIFEDVYMCYRLYGTIFLICIGLIVMAGVRVVNKFALPAVCIVVVCIIFCILGAFVNVNGKDSLQFCMVGDRITNLMKWGDHHEKIDVREACNASYLERIFCDNSTGVCDQYFANMRAAGRIGPINAIDGMASGVIGENVGSKYLKKGQVLTNNLTVDPTDTSDTSQYYVWSDVSTGFMILIGVFFPSCTGIMAGSNRSGDLKDASQSIPRGTIAATTSTSFVYLVGVLLFGASINEMFIRDKFGEGAYGKLVIAELAIPHPVAILIGCFLSTVGAGMQSLTGAPRLFQAIAKDGVIPILAPFQASTKHGEPLRAILLTLCICEVGILIAQLESITALITQFFLMCYLSVNTACALQSLLKSPGWRPGFKYYHWSLSCAGAVLCIAVMFISHWWFAFFAIGVGGIVYKYIGFKGAEKEWGDGIGGLNMSAARFALLNMEDKTPHTRNWRPQLLVLTPSDPASEPDRYERLLGFVSQLKAGKGLTVLSSVIEGDFVKCADHSDEVKEMLRESIKRHKIRGFCDVLICRNKCEGIASLVQTSGLGSMRHNTIVLPWPDNWNENEDQKACSQFVETVRVSSAAHCALLVPKNVAEYPVSNDKITGHMDVWWIVHDGGMLMLLPFLLRQHRTWRRTQLRIFTVAHVEDNSPKMKEDLKTFLYHLRINAEIDVIEMLDSDISEYAYERTLKMEQRHRILRDMHMSSKKKSMDVQSAVMDTNYQKRKLSQMAEDQRRLSEVHEEHSPTKEINSSHPTTQSTSATPESVESPESDPNENQPLLSENEDPGQANQARQVTAEDKTENGPSVKFAPGTADHTAKEKKYGGLKQYNVRRMHTAVRLNEAMRSKSSDAQLIVVNLPGPPKHTSDQFYMEFVEALTEGLDRVLLVKGCGTEVVTIYS